MDELTTTYASPNTGPLLLEGPALPGSAQTSSESDSAAEKSQVSVNLRLPNDMKMEWIEQYHSNLGSTIKPPIILFGMSLKFYDKVVNLARSVQVSICFFVSLFPRTLSRTGNNAGQDSPRVAAARDNKNFLRDTGRD